MDFSEKVYSEIKAEYEEFARKLECTDIRFIPISALNGDNVVKLSENTPWYSGSPLMEILEFIEINSDPNYHNMRFPVQYVNRPNLDFRGYCGTIASGIIRKNDRVTVLPSGLRSKIESIITYEGEIEEAFPPMAVTVTLEDEIDISRGDTICLTEDLPLVSDHFDATLVWMTETSMTLDKEYYIKLGPRMITGSVSRIHSRTDVNTLEDHPADSLNLNEIGLCEISLNSPICFDAYRQNKAGGSFIIIDRLSNITVGAGMITGLASREHELDPVTALDRAARFSQRPTTLWFVGKTTLRIAQESQRKLFDSGHPSAIISNPTESDVNSITSVLNKAGLITLCVCESHPATLTDNDLIVNTADSDADSVMELLRKNHIID